MDILKGVKLVVFDLDGTLFHLDVDWERIKHQLQIKDGENLGDRTQYLLDINSPEIAIITNAELDSVKGKRLSQEVMDTLMSLLQKDIRVAIFTRNSKKVVEALVSNTPLVGNLFIVGREDVAYQKPHKQGLVQLMQQSGVNESEAILVGDTYHDIQATRDAGLKSAIIVKNSRLVYQPKGADYYIEKIEELIQE